MIDRKRWFELFEETIAKYDEVIVALQGETQPLNGPISKHGDGIYQVEGAATNKVTGEPVQIFYMFPFEAVIWFAAVPAPTGTGALTPDEIERLTASP